MRRFMNAHHHTPRYASVTNAHPGQPATTLAPTYRKCKCAWKTILVSHGYLPLPVSGTNGFNGVIWIPAFAGMTTGLYSLNTHLIECNIEK